MQQMHEVGQDSLLCTSQPGHVLALALVKGQVHKAMGPLKNWRERRRKKLSLCLGQQKAALFQVQASA